MKFLQIFLFVLLIGNIACAAGPIPLTIEQKKQHIGGVPE